MWFVFCAMVVLTCFVMCGCQYVWILLSVGVLVICVLVFTVFCIVCTVFLCCFVYVYYLFCLYWCKDYCHRVKTELQRVIIMINL